MKKISYKVDNGALTIWANYFEGTHDRAVILLHMMSATKESWDTMADKFHQRGFDVLSIDLRGHGESVQYRISEGNGFMVLDYNKFSDAEHQASIRDVEGAREWLIKQGVKPGNIYVGGASIGANLAIKYMGDHPECPAGFALSPGTNYRGIEILPVVKRMLSLQRLYIAVAKDDGRVQDAFPQATKIYDVTSAQKEIKIFETGGHGTGILDAHPGLSDELVGWFLAEI